MPTKGEGSTKFHGPHFPFSLADRGLCSMRNGLPGPRKAQMDRLRKQAPAGHQFSGLRSSSRARGLEILVLRGA